MKLQQKDETFKRWKEFWKSKSFCCIVSTYRNTDPQESLKQSKCPYFLFIRTYLFWWTILWKFSPDVLVICRSLVVLTRFWSNQSWPWAIRNHFLKREQNKYIVDSLINTLLSYLIILEFFPLANNFLVINLMKEHLVENYTSFVKKLWEKKTQQNITKVHPASGNNKVIPSQQKTKSNPST